jgi:dihydroflavonol-4-reductase
MEGCELVYHTASPYTISVKDPQKELVDPALNGTRNVLNQAYKTASVKRVVVTSSCAAIYCDAIDCAKGPNGFLTEEVWNTTATLDYQPYSFSKTLAEKESWKMADAQSKWDLVVVNPSAVYGPDLNAKWSTSESMSIMKQMGDGTLKMGAPRLGIGAVDVRDLAEAHFQAGFRPEAKGRHIISGHNTNFFEIAQTLLPKYGEKYPLPKSVAPKWLLMLVGPFVNKAFTRGFIKKNVDVVWKADNSKSIKVLGVTYRPLKETMVDSFQMLIDEKIISSTK